MAGLKRKLSKQLKNASSPFWQDLLPVVAQQQREFDIAVSSFELDDIYQFAVDRLPAKPHYALTLLQRIAAYPLSHPIQTHARNQMALYLLNEYEPEKDQDKELLQLINSTLTSHHDDAAHYPALPVAAVYAHFLSGLWREAAHSLMNLPELSWQSVALAKTFANLSLGGNLDFLTADNPEQLTAFETILTWAKTHHRQAWVPVSLVTGELYIHQGAFLAAFQLYSDLLKAGHEDACIYSKLGETCWYLNRLSEAEQFYGEAINRLSATDTGSDGEKTLQAAKVTLAVILCEQGKNIEQAIDLFEEQITKGMISNPVYHNLAMCYYWQQDYQKSLDFCRKALKLSTDETTLLLVAKNHQALKQFVPAVKWCEKALAFIETIDLSFVIDKGNRQSISFSRPEWLNEKKRDIYQCLIQCYMESSDYQAASDRLQEASALWPRDAGLAHLATTLATLKADQSKTAAQAAQAASEQDNLINTIKDEFLHRYPSAHPLTVEFLATGEYLFRTYHSQTPDYSPVLLPFAKALENELAIRLGRQGHITANRKYTLGELAYGLKKHTGSTPLVTAVKSIVKLRNDAAHQKLTTRPAVEEIRNKLFDDAWFEMILDL